MAQTEGGIKELDVTIAALAQITAIIAGVGPIFELGLLLKQKLTSTGTTAEEAAAKIAAFDAALEVAYERNVAWRETHPRI